MTALQSPKRRERFLLVLFPAALILAVYSIFFAIPAQRKLQERQAKYRAAQDVAIKPYDADLSRQKLENTKLGLQRLKSNIAANRARLREISQAWRHTDNRLATLQQITEMLRDHDLSVVFQGFKNEQELSNYNRELIDIINRQGPENALEYWQIELQGSFPHVTQFLDSINSQQLGIIPVSITMKLPPNKGNEKNWIIVFLI